MPPHTSAALRALVTSLPCFAVAAVAVRSASSASMRRRWASSAAFLASCKWRQAKVEWCELKANVMNECAVSVAHLQLLLQVGDVLCEPCLGFCESAACLGGVTLKEQQHEVSTN